MALIEAITGWRGVGVTKYSSTEFELITYNLDGTKDDSVPRSFKTNDEAQEKFETEVGIKAVSALTAAIAGLMFVAEGYLTLDKNGYMGACEITVGLLLWRLTMDFIHQGRLAEAGYHKAKSG
ncbi:MAG: hypothetical protein ACHQUA_01635 [Microgenomates group bacterium]